MNFASLFANPQFWTILLHSASAAVEQASPDYTIAHHIAATLDSVLGNKPISTPNAAAATPVAAAITGAVLQAATGAVVVGGK